MTLSDLIARLEKCTGPSRELDAEIAVALRIMPKPNAQAGDISWIDRNFPEWTALDNGNLAVLHDGGRTGVHWKSEPYTSSIDQALTLLPDDSWEWNLGWNSGLAFAEVGDPLLYMDGEAKTPATALCIAALKARKP